MGILFKMGIVVSVTLIHDIIIDIILNKIFNMEIESI